MRKAEWLSLGAFAFFILSSLLRSLPNKRRFSIAATGVTGIVLIVALQFGEQFFSPSTVSLLRDCLPAVLMPMVYWQAGWFSGKINHSLQENLQRIDQKLFGTWMSTVASKRSYRWIATILELAYVSCYVLVPLSLAVLHLGDQERHTTEYWSVVLLATYPCYVFTAFVPTHPPRLLETNRSQTFTGQIRRFNLWLVTHLTTQLNTFPSAHVTATLGGSLVLLHFLPRIGLAFVLVSIGIALGAVLGRYHYAVDVLLAVALSLGVYAFVFLFS